MLALKKDRTWDVVDLPHWKEPICCKWVFIVKLQSNGMVERGIMIDSQGLYIDLEGLLSGDLCAYCKDDFFSYLDLCCF